MYYLIKTKNSIPSILGQFEDYEDAEEALEEANGECVIVGDVEEFLETLGNVKKILNGIVDELAKANTENMLMKLKLKQLCSN